MEWAVPAIHKTGKECDLVATQPCVVISVFCAHVEFQALPSFKFSLERFSDLSRGDESVSLAVVVSCEFRVGNIHANDY